jgi:hypothetical protein
VNTSIINRYERAVPNLLSSRNKINITAERARIQKKETYPNIWIRESSGRFVNLHIAEPIETTMAMKANKNATKLRHDLSIFIIL